MAPRGWDRPGRRPAAAPLHGDERGTISLVTIFSVMLLAMLFGMVLNAGRQADGKVKMQNASDAAAWSSGIVLARTMNSLAFTDHLLCDIFSLTAILREASQHNAEQMVPPILAAWSKVGPVFSQSQFAKFRALGPAITAKVPLEQKMVTAYGNWNGATANLILPVWEQILAQQLIPQFQRALVSATPQLAQTAANEIARRHGLGSPERGPMGAMVWLASGAPLQDPTTALPVVDPQSNAQYQQIATQQRNKLANTYLNQWNNNTLAGFDQFAKMSQFGTLWRGFTCGQLDKLLNQDYPNTNLPFVIRTPPNQSGDKNPYLEANFKFVNVAYWPQLHETLPGLFKNANHNDALAFSEYMLFVPSRRLVRNPVGGGGGGAAGMNIGGAPGGAVTLPGQGAQAGGAQAGGGAAGAWNIGRDSTPTAWDLLNQSWRVKIVPAISAGIPTILQSSPQWVTLIDNGQQRGVRTPQLGGLSQQQLNLINTH